jgi:formylglycine-generating enzyme required for sulfatase activity
MAQIPGGKFKMGGVSSHVAVDKPVHEVTVASFQMDVTEVTLAAYREAVQAGVVPEPLSRPYAGGAGATGVCNWEVKNRDDHPVNCVTWEEAVAYCKWVGKRLPTEEEWEYAAKGGDENRQFPWGTTDPFRDTTDWKNGAAHGCWSRTSGNLDQPHNYTCPVGKFPESRSKWGLDDMAGNVEEWTSSLWSRDYNAPRESDKHVVRGGSFTSSSGGYRSDWVLYTSNRNVYGIDSHNNNINPSDNGNHMSIIGFRCAK